MHFFYVLHFHRHRTLVKRAYAAVKLAKAFLVGGGVLMLQLLLLAAQIARERLNPRDHFHEVFEF